MILTYNDFMNIETYFTMMQNHSSLTEMGVFTGFFCFANYFCEHPNFSNLQLHPIKEDVWKDEALSASFSLDENGFAFMWKENDTMKKLVLQIKVDEVVLKRINCGIKTVKAYEVFYGLRDAVRRKEVIDFKGVRNQESHHIYLVRHHLSDGNRREVFANEEERKERMILSHFWHLDYGFK